MLTMTAHRVARNIFELSAPCSVIWQRSRTHRTLDFLECLINNSTADSSLLCCVSPFYKFSLHFSLSMSGRSGPSPLFPRARTENRYLELSQTRNAGDVRTEIFHSFLFVPHCLFVVLYRMTMTQ